eukprot:7212467-Alexandrium_andersonii.AAC.1
MCIRDRLKGLTRTLMLALQERKPRGDSSGSPRYALGGGACRGAPREVPRQTRRAYSLRAADG